MPLARNISGFAAVSATWKAEDDEAWAAVAELSVTHDYTPKTRTFYAQ
jgi:hypothetical protein